MAGFKHRRIALRRSQTRAEAQLWLQLRNSRFEGLKFRRQHEIGPYIVDFYCHGQRLVIEVDGSQHFEAEALTRDSARTDYLEAQGLRVLRVTNAEVLNDIDAVLDRIWSLATPSP